MQHLGLDLELHDRRTHAAIDLLNAAADGSQGPVKRHTRRDHFEDLVLCVGKLVIEFAFGDIGDTDPDQFAIPGRQAAEAHLARYLFAVRIHVQPLEYRMVAIKRTGNMTTTHAERRRPIRLLFRTDCFRADAQQPGSRHVE